MSRFSMEDFLSHSPERFRRGTLLCCVSENFCRRKTFLIRGEGIIKILRRNMCVSQ